jgi:hypothetical protein
MFSGILYDFIVFLEVVQEIFAKKKRVTESKYIKEWSKYTKE